ncbi:hypothetical protein FD724_06815 [Nostoc sp. C057]|nr:hypothetical protein FD724_06815 [Nostoc sp. C057]
MAGGNLSIEQDIKAIASLKKTGADYFERLNSQIKLLADLGIEQELFLSVSRVTQKVWKFLDRWQQPRICLK